MPATQKDNGVPFQPDPAPETPEVVQDQPGVAMLLRQSSLLRDGTTSEVDDRYIRITPEALKVAYPGAGLSDTYQSNSEPIDLFNSPTSALTSRNQTIRGASLSQTIQEPMWCGRLEDHPESDRLMELEKAIVFELPFPDGISPNNFSPSTANEWESTAASEGALEIYDKVAQRVLADEIGIFAQPLWRDLRNKNRGEVHCCFSQVNFSSVDWNAIANAPNLYVFINLNIGFAVEVRDDKSVAIHTSNSLIEEVVSETDRDLNSLRNEKWLLQFIAKLEGHQDYKIYYRSLGANRADPESISQAANAILAYPGTLYLKSTRSSGGSHIVKIGKDKNGQSVLESNSPDLLETLNWLESKYNKTVRFFQRFPTKKDSPDFLWQQHERNLKETTPHIANVLRAILTQTSNPTIEVEIPRVKRGADLAEFRIICQKTISKEPPKVTGHYTKISNLTVSANVSLGGHGESSLKVLEEIYMQELPQQLPDGVETRLGWAARLAAASLEVMIEKVTRFATALDKKYQEKGVAPNSILRTDFAVDLVPTWNAATNQIEFVLLEIQTPYGFDGLIQSDPAAAELVTKTKEVLARRNVAAKLLAVMQRVKEKI